MEISEEERKWAVAIKEAAKADPEINETKISDLEFLQHAIIAKDKTDKAISRLRNMQVLKERYGIQGDGSLEAAQRDMTTFQRLYPGFLLSLAKANAEKSASIDGVHVFCSDISKALCGTAKTEEGYAVRFRNLFYLLQAMNANALSMRSGYCCVLNASDMRLQNFNLEQERPNSPLYSGAAYPVRVQQLAVINARPLVRIFYGIVSLFMPTAIRKRTVIVNADTDTFFKSSKNYSKKVLPLSWGGHAEENFVEAVLARLRERYENEDAFSLSTVLLFCPPFVDWLHRHAGFYVFSLACSAFHFTYSLSNWM